MVRRALVSLLILSLAGCGPQVRMTGYLDRQAASFQKGATFFVAENSQAFNPLLEREIKEKIERLLLRHGYGIEGERGAAYRLSFGYGLGQALQSSFVTSFLQPRTEIVSVPDGKGGMTARPAVVPGAPVPVPVVTTEYLLYLLIRVAEGSPGEEGRVIWVGEALSLEHSLDLRADMDYLLAALFANFGRDTARQIVIRVGQDQPDLRELRRPRQGG